MKCAEFDIKDPRYRQLYSGKTSGDELTLLDVAQELVVQSFLILILVKVKAVVVLDRARQATKVEFRPGRLVLVPTPEDQILAGTGKDRHLVRTEDIRDVEVDTQIDAQVGHRDVVELNDRNDQRVTDKGGVVGHLGCHRRIVGIDLLGHVKLGIGDHQVAVIYHLVVKVIPL